jgi:hypothetical protein
MSDDLFNEIGAEVNEPARRLSATVTGNDLFERLMAEANGYAQNFWNCSGNSP